MNAFRGFSPTRVVSGGPFEITSYEPGKELTLSRNPDYWGPAAHVARIRFVEESTSGLEEGLDSGAITVAELSSSQPFQVASHRFVTSMGADDEIWQLCFNLAAPVVSDISVRRGIEHSLDRSEIVDDSEDLADPHARPAVSRFLMSGESASTSAAGSLAAPDLYRPSTAFSYFAKAGYFTGSGGLLRRSETGPPLRVDLMVPRGLSVVDRAALVIQAELRSIGVSVVLERRPLDEMLSTLLPSGQYQMALAPFAVSTTIAEMAPDYTFPVGPVATDGGAGTGATGASGAAGTGTGTGGTGGSTGKASTGARTGGRAAVAPVDVAENWVTAGAPDLEPGAVTAGVVTRDVFGFEAPSVGVLLAQALSDLDTSTMWRDLGRVEAVLWNRVVSIPLFQPTFELVRSARLANVDESPTAAGIMWDAEDWAVVTSARHRHS